MNVGIPTELDADDLIAQLAEDTGVEYKVAAGFSDLAREGETGISMVDPKAAWAVLKADAKRDTSNELLGGVGARALGSKRKSNGPVRRKVMIYSDSFSSAKMVVMHEDGTMDVHGSKHGTSQRVTACDVKLWLSRHTFWWDDEEQETEQPRRVAPHPRVATLPKQSSKGGSGK